MPDSLKRAIVVLACSAPLVVPAVDAWASTREKASKKRAAVVTKVVKGTLVECPLTAVGHTKLGQWGTLQVALKFSKVPGSKKFKIVAVTWPIWPQHTVRSSFINSKALPLIEQQVVELQSTKIESISGATQITDSFIQSLQAALVAAANA